MSGGHFDYNQRVIWDIAASIENLLNSEQAADYTTATINELHNAIDTLNAAAIYANRVDWLVSGDDGEDSFHERLNTELAMNEAAAHERRRPDSLRH